VNKRLLDQFFKENTLESDGPTAPALAHFYLRLEGDPEASERIRAVMDEAILGEQPGREATMLAERRGIEAAETCERIIRLMRRDTDPMNLHILVGKALAFKDEIVPELIRMLKTSMNDGFIETAIRILTRSEMDIAGELIENYDDMRSPYAQSMVLVVLGYIADETCVAWLIDQHKKLKRLYPIESYCEGAYYALCEIDSRFYPAGKTPQKYSRSSSK